MNSKIRKIINYLYLNYQYIEDSGLLNGNMGLAILYYEYSRYSKINVYSDFADFLIDDVFEVFLNNPELYNLNDFYSGICGVGWGIQYLVDNGFADEDPDEVLSVFDKKMEEILFTSDDLNEKNAQIYFQTEDRILGIDHYFFYRKKNDEEYAGKILGYYEKIFVPEISYPLFFLNSVLAYLIKIRNSGLDIPLQRMIEEKVLAGIYSSISKKTYDESDLIILSRLLENFDSNIKNEVNNFLTENNVKSNTSSIDDIFLYSKITWQELLYHGKVYTKIDEKLLAKFLDEDLFNLSSKKLALNNGLAGLALNIVLTDKQQKSERKE